MHGVSGGGDAVQNDERLIAERLFLASRLKAFAGDGTFDVNDAVDVALFLTDRLRARAGVSTVRELTVDLPRVKAPLGQFEQALVNVLLNAYQAASRQGLVRVSTQRHGRDDRLSVCIEDNGEGIAEDALKRAFEPFYSTWGRMGLGLSVAQQLVEKFGGKIEMESHPGQGARVRIELSAVGGPQHANQSAKGIKGS